MNVNFALNIMLTILFSQYMFSIHRELHQAYKLHIYLVIQTYLNQKVCQKVYLIQILNISID